MFNGHLKCTGLSCEHQMSALGEAELLRARWEAAVEAGDSSWDGSLPGSVRSGSSYTTVGLRDTDKDLSYLTKELEVCVCVCAVRRARRCRHRPTGAVWATPQWMACCASVDLPNAKTHPRVGVAARVIWPRASLADRSRRVADPLFSLSGSSLADRRSLADRISPVLMV